VTHRAAATLPLERLARERDEALARASLAEQRNDQLLRLCVSLSLLSGAVNTDAVASALAEIVVNVVGSESFVILEHGAAGESRTLASMGMDAIALARMARGEGDAVARVPLRVGTDTVGELAIAALLEHKPALDPFDHELLAILSTAAGSALHGARLRDAAGVPA
jgi:hypothetical protein